MYLYNLLRLYIPLHRARNNSKNRRTNLMAQTMIKKRDGAKKQNGLNTNTTLCMNPATGETIAEFKTNTIEEIYNAVERGRVAQAQWAQVPVKKRVKHIRKIIRYITDHADEIADTISRDNGKTRTDAIAAEVVPAAMGIGYYCNNAPKFLRDRKLKTGNILFINKRSRIARVPFGVVGIISPWNYPFSIPCAEVVMALLAGNAVLLKAATETQMVGHILKECIESAGLPEGIFTYINIPGSVAGDAFIDAGVDKLFFTGSVPVGKYLMKKASETLTPLVLELGGNDPMIVCEDADLERAAAGAVWAGLQNAGQSCGGVERIYVQQKVYDTFMGLLKSRVESLRIGPGTSMDNDIGAITTRRQMDTVTTHITDALDRGATVFAQSKPPEGLKGNFMPCTVLTDVNHDMLVMKDETFGPVLGVMPFDTIKDAIDMANNSNLGLTASVWSKNRRRAMGIGRNIRAGAVMINDHLMSHGLAETPWGGFKESGIGRTHGDIGFSEMTHPQVIVNDIMPFAKRNFWWHPHDEKLYRGLKAVITFLYSGSISARVKSAFTLTGAFMRTFRRI